MIIFVDTHITDPRGREMKPTAKTPNYEKKIQQQLIGQQSAEWCHALPLIG
jgi:hypothetical protein